MTLQRIVVVGASLAGLRAVEALRRRGFSGSLTLVGDEPHLPYDRPPLSKELLRGEWTPEETALRPGGFEDLDLELRIGCRATGLDLERRQVSLTDGSTVPFDGLVIATGAAPIWPGGLDRLEGVHVLRTLDQALSIRDALVARPRLVVVGGGFVGLEVAASARQLGLEVTVVEALELPLVRSIGPTMARVCAAMHRDQGIDLRCGTTVTAVEGHHRVERVRLSDGSTLACDLVVVGVGVRPCTEWLEGSGLDVEDGVLCDATCSAGAGVVAAGDVARWYNPLFGETMRVEHWTHAVEQADAAARRLLEGDSAPEFSTAPLFWSDQFDRRIQLAGRVRPDDRVEVIRGDTSEYRFAALYGRANRLVGVLGFSMPGQVIRHRFQVARSADFEHTLAAARG